MSDMSKPLAVALDHNMRRVAQLKARVSELEDNARTPAEDAVLQASVALQRARAAKPADEDEDTDEYCEWQDALWRALEAHKEAVDALLAAEAPSWRAGR